ncbi:MAG: Asp23/Gls24 family envelope stress response protein [Lachnospiraceae bacterium]|nr:Asp23/Gls24 family envelope stress response protein [Lachnospiraceae bacterium]
MAKEASAKIGSLRIADDVVPVIAALAATEVDGVVSIADKNVKEVVKRGVRKAPKGVRVEINGRQAKVDVSVGIDSVYNVPETSRKVQERVKTSIETMTGLEVVDVNVRISSVLLPKFE